MQKKLLIAIQGFYNSGKTSMLKKICKLIVNLDKCIKYAKISNTFNDEKNVNEELNWKIEKELQFNNDDDDVYIFDVNNTIIGVATEGDSAKRLEKRLNYFTDRKCEIIIAAARAKGKTVQVLYDYVENNKIDFIPIFKTRLLEIFKKDKYEEYDNNLANEILNIIKLKINYYK